MTVTWGSWELVLMMELMEEETTDEQLYSVIRRDRTETFRNRRE